IRDQELAISTQPRLTVTREAHTVSGLRVEMMVSQCQRPIHARLPREPESARTFIPPPETRAGIFLTGGIGIESLGADNVRRFGYVAHLIVKAAWARIFPMADQPQRLELVGFGRQLTDAGEFVLEPPAVV